MSTQTTNFPPLTAPMPHRFSGWLRKRLSEHLRRRELKLTRRRLHGLSDHTLRDIGLTRDQVETYAPSHPKWWLG